jgi:short-subunit dehydrogenase
MTHATVGARRTVLITGASAGIGEAFANIYAARGFDPILAARRRDRLEELAARLEREHGVRANAIAADLTDHEAPRTLCDALDREGRTVDVLVNNAGYAVPGSYRAAAWSQHADFLQVMVVAYAELAHRLLPGMIERRWGRIVNVASLAGLVPGTAGHTLYAASKSFLVKFSQSLGMEVDKYGVHVTAVCPGYTHTEFHAVAGLESLTSRLPRVLWMDARTVAQQGYEASEAGRLVYVNGRMNKAIAVAARLMPDSLLYGVVRRVAGRVRRQ